VLEPIGLKLGRLDFFASALTGPDFGGLDLTWLEPNDFDVLVAAPVVLGI
jgi:hypothetical protein